MSMAGSSRSRARRLAWAAAAAAALSLAAWLIQAASIAYPRHRLAFTPDPGTWRGVYHVHTQASDGRGTIEDVVAAARASKAAWVLIADHNVLQEPRFRIVDGVLLVFSPEVSTGFGHATALGVSRALTRPERRAPEAPATIRALGGFPVAAHPLGRKRPYARLDDPDLAGLEILSADQEFRDALVSPSRLLPAALAYLVNPQHAVMQLLQRPDRTLSKWDALLAARPLAGFCAVDAHGRPSYAVMMASLQMHAVVGQPPTGDAAADGEALVGALARGRAFCGIETIGAAGGFRFGAASGAGAAGMGDEIRLDERPVLHVALDYDESPPGLRAVMLCNGAEVDLTSVHALKGRQYEYRPDRPGACRVEVSIDAGRGRMLPWILSNPIYVR
ncbi:MAG: hypothetical protein R6V57_01185 [Vicinamibacterales bacterium]